MSSIRSSTINDWSAWELLQIINADDFSFTCVGYAPSKGRRCRNRIANPDKIATKRILDSLPEFVDSTNALEAQLRIVVPMAICKNRECKHQDQADSIVGRWYDTIMAAAGRSRFPTLEASGDDDGDEDGRSIVLDSVQTVEEPLEGEDSAIQLWNQEIEDSSEASSVTFAGSRASSLTRSASISTSHDPDADADSWFTLDREADDDSDDGDDDTADESNSQAQASIFADAVIAADNQEEAEPVQPISETATELVSSQDARRCHQQVALEPERGIWSAIWRTIGLTR